MLKLPYSNYKKRHKYENKKRSEHIIALFGKDLQGSFLFAFGCALAMIRCATICASVIRIAVGCLDVLGHFIL